MRAFFFGLTFMGLTAFQASAEHYVCTFSGRSVDAGWTPKVVEIWEDSASGTFRSKSDFVHDQAEHPVEAKLVVSNMRRNTYSFGHKLAIKSIMPSAWNHTGYDGMAYGITIMNTDMSAIVRSKRVGYSTFSYRETGKCTQK